jgi:hypothetical protein
MTAAVLQRKFFVAGDRARATAQTLVDSAGAAIDLTGQTVRWELWTADDGERVLFGAATIDAAAAGQVSYAFTADDATFAVANPGRYRERWIRIDAATLTEHFPTHGVIELWFKKQPGT